MTVSLRPSTSSIEAVDCLLPTRCRFSASPSTHPVQHGTDHAVSVPGVDTDVAQALVDAAHRTRPCSKATRGNIDVVVTVA